MGLFTDLFSTAPADAAAKAQQAGLTNANTSSSADLMVGQAGADSLYGSAEGDLSGLASSTQKGSDAYADASGANGADGLARAKALFQADPGYTGGLDTGIDQVNRNAAVTGNLGGGQTSADEIKFASDYDAQKYGSYVSSLAPYLGANSSAVTSLAGAKGAQAGADLGVASTKATNDYNTASGIGNSQAQADMAPYQASSNFWSSLMGVGNLALKATGLGGPATSAASTVKLGSPAGPAVYS